MTKHQQEAELDTVCEDCGTKLETEDEFLVLLCNKC